MSTPRLHVTSVVMGKWGLRAVDQGAGLVPARQGSGRGPQEPSPRGSGGAGPRAGQLGRCVTRWWRWCVCVGGGGYAGRVPRVTWCAARRVLLSVGPGAAQPERGCEVSSRRGAARSRLAGAGLGRARVVRALCYRER